MCQHLVSFLFQLLLFLHLSIIFLNFHLYGELVQGSWMDEFHSLCGIIKISCCAFAFALMEEEDASSFSLLEKTCGQC